MTSIHHDVNEEEQQWENTLRVNSQTTSWKKKINKARGRNSYSICPNPLARQCVTEFFFIIFYCDQPLEENKFKDTLEMFRVSCTNVGCRQRLRKGRGSGASNEDIFKSHMNCSKHRFFLTSKFDNLFLEKKMYIKKHKYWLHFYLQIVDLNVCSASPGCQFGLLIQKILIHTGNSWKENFYFKQFRNVCHLFNIIL